MDGDDSIGCETINIHRYFAFLSLSIPILTPFSLQPRTLSRQLDALGNVKRRATRWRAIDLGQSVARQLFPHLFPRANRRPSVASLLHREPCNSYRSPIAGPQNSDATSILNQLCGRRSDRTLTASVIRLVSGQFREIQFTIDSV